MSTVPKEREREIIRILLGSKHTYRVGKMEPNQKERLPFPTKNGSPAVIFQSPFKTLL
jgi:hypothetical protein